MRGAVGQGRAASGRVGRAGQEEEGKPGHFE